MTVLLMSIAVHCHAVILEQSNAEDSSQNSYMELVAN